MPLHLVNMAEPCTWQRGEGWDMDRAKASRKEGIKKGATITLHLSEVQMKPNYVIKNLPGRNIATYFNCNRLSFIFHCIYCHTLQRCVQWKGVRQEAKERGERVDERMNE